MDPDSLFSLFVIFGMILSGIYFSATETAFSALSRVRVKTIGEENQKKAKRAALVLNLHDQFDELLSTLLVLNNLVTLIAAALTTLIAVRYNINPTLTTTTLSVIIIFLGDITPKSLAKESPEKFAMACAPLLRLCMIMVKPISYIFGHWKVLLSRIFNTSVTDDGMTKEELYSYVEVAHQDDAIDEEGKQLLDSALEFDELRAIDILMPRIDVVGISETASIEEVTQMFFETEYSRLPVYRDSMDNIIGIVHMRDFFKFTARKNKDIGSLESLFTPPLFVAPSTKLRDLLKELQRQKSHLAIVADEYGGTAGIVTMEDILEELVGDIWDESDEIVVEFDPLGENRYKVICSAYTKDLFAYFDLPEDTEADATSVSGWIMDKLGKLPEEGDSFTFEDLTVTVHKTEHRRVLECIVEVKEELGKEIVRGDSS